MTTLSPALIRKTARLMAANERSVTIGALADELGQRYGAILTIVNSTFGLRCELELLENRVERYPRISEIQWVALPWLAAQLKNHNPQIQHFS